MYLNSYVIYKGKLTTWCKSMSTANYTIQINDPLWEEQWQKKKRATRISGTKKKCRNWFKTP